MANVLGGDDPGRLTGAAPLLARDPRLQVHLYGKEVRPGRKVGHVTALGDDLDETADARRARRRLPERTRGLTT